MWDTDNKSNYEGLFARNPDQTEDTIWGRKETHSNFLSGDAVVQKDWYGNVQSVEQSGWWCNS